MSGPPEIPELAYTDPIAYSKTLPPIYHLKPAHGAITDDNHGAYVVIVAWIMMCFFTISVLTRLLTRTIPVLTAGIDDVLCGLAMVFGIVQTGVIYNAATNGLGRRQDDLSPSLFETYAKAYYTANLFLILTLACAKASLIFLIVRLSPARSVRRICYALLGGIALWAAVFLFLFAFQCPTPSPWDYNQQCALSTGGLYYAFAGTDIATDLLVTILPAYVIWSVQIPIRKRITVIAVFASRLVVPLCVALRMSSFPPYVAPTADRSWEVVTPQTWAQVIQCLSIITACIPCLKPFLESLESGFMDMSMTGHTGATYGGASSGSGNHGTKSKSGTRGGGTGGSGGESYVLSSFTSSGKGAGGHEVSVHAKAQEMYLGRGTPTTGGIRGEALGGGGGTQGNIADGRYLDVNASSGATSELKRNPSVAESERALTSKSSEHSEDFVRDTRGFDFAGMRAAAAGAGGSPRRGRGEADGRHAREQSDGGGIRVTREVEIRNEGSFDVRGGQEYGRRW
ncbi:uncharacterized protein HMPREF1541_10169 [Cyphellophora europaea CBS 101466]|uniref:Rhodopsin domain-containing protein n=1 Tax=Cyphellophora europaea (strain CBS 101466) TaxID=1220924 RepID=W2S9B9_CYPE1|nr:uncharacterized protein HMPREF1541_10169 [Cyphellophora europaea CBS 101466]ETN44499.1 hypothetical protein HMPREF1541_10169 [Cyphellophora europaea CBS 101466]